MARSFRIEYPVAIYHIHPEAMPACLSLMMIVKEEIFSSSSWHLGSKEFIEK